MLQPKLYVNYSNLQILYSKANQYLCYCNVMRPTKVKQIMHDTVDDTIINTHLPQTERPLVFTHQNFTVNLNESDKGHKYDQKLTYEY